MATLDVGDHDTLSHKITLLMRWNRNSNMNVKRTIFVTLLLVLSLLNSVCVAEPQSGWWWNPNEPGRGFFIETKNGSVFMGSFLYASQGYPLWYVTGPSVIANNWFSGTLGIYSGGQTLTGNYRTPTGSSTAGNVSVTFTDATHGTINLGNNSISIERFEIAAGSMSTSKSVSAPETGWWWNANEGGRGFAIEVQGDNIFIVGFMYDEDGNPVWYATGGKMATPTLYQGTWAQYGNGQILGGTWKEANITNPNLGSALFSFDSTTTGLLQLPDGRRISLTRFVFHTNQSPLLSKDSSIAPSITLTPGSGEFGAMVTASDGGIWVGGTEKGFYGRAYLFKFGSTEPNPCGRNGIRMLSELSKEFERHPTIQTMTTPRAGKFYIAGRAPSGLYISRYSESTCQPDPTFGKGGHVAIPNEGLSPPSGIRVLEDSSRNVVTLANYTGRVVLRRLTPEGNWDNTFGISGQAINPNVDNFWLGEASISSSGEIFVGGSVEIPYGFLPAVIKFDQNGRIVSSFGIAGLQRYPTLNKGTGGVVRILVESNRFVFLGNTARSVAIDDIATNDSFIAAADLDTGLLLPEFGNKGGLIWDWGYNNSNIANSFIKNGRGGYTTCGHAIKGFISGQAIALADFTYEGKPDASIGDQGRRLVISLDTVASCVAVTLDGGGRLFIAGQDSTNPIVMSTN